jgi:hypothetical protein
MRFAIVALLAGCSFQHGTVGGGDAMRGDGPIIDGPPIDVAIDGAANIDTDGDGVFDNVDNCLLVANANQHDEDTDAVGDVCDPCPQVADAVTDGDGDHIPDACDPHPAAMGDQLVKFEPFTGTTLPSGWTIAAGAATDFVVGGDAISINAAASTHIMIFDTNSQTHAIDVGVTLPASAVSTTFFTALTDTKSDTSQYFGCGVRIDTTSREFFSYEDPTFTTIATDPAPSEAPVFPGTFRIVSVLGSQQTCTIPGAQADHVMTASANTNNRTYVGVRVGKVAVQVRYIAIYKF